MSALKVFLITVHQTRKKENLMESRKIISLKITLVYRIYTGNSPGVSSYKVIP
jgi:hypothetical protein